MAKDEPTAAGKGGEPQRDDGVPRPPSREDLERIGRDQALITDEWTGEPPPGGSGGDGGDRAPAPGKDGGGGRSS